MNRQQLLDYIRPLVRRELEKPRRGNKQVFNVEGVIEGMNTNRKYESDDEIQAGLTFAGLVRCLAASGGHLGDAQGIAQKNYGVSSAVHKALAAGRLDAGGIMIADDLAMDVIELLRPHSVVRQAGPRTISAPTGTKTFPRIDQGASAAYIAEGQDIPTSQPKMGGPVLSVKKMAALVPINNELLTFGGSGVDSVIRDDLISEMGRVEDVNFLRGDGFQGHPKGLRYLAAEANVIPAGGDSDPEDIEADLMSLMNQLDDANVRMIRPGWVMSTRTRNRLFNLRGETSGQLLFPEVRTGSLLGMPLYTSNNIPNDLGNGDDETEIMLVDFNEVIVGEVEGIRVETSRDGSYLENSSMASAFSRDQTLIRAVLFHDITVRHPEAVAILTAVTWQNPPSE